MRASPPDAAAAVAAVAARTDAVSNVVAALGRSLVLRVAV